MNLDKPSSTKTLNRISIINFMNVRKLPINKFDV